MPKDVLEMQEQMKDQPMPELTEEIVQLCRGLFAQKLRAVAGHGARATHRTSPHAPGDGVREMANLEEIGEDLRHGGDEPDVPLIVLSAMGVDLFQAAAMPEALERETAEVKRALHAELAQKFPQGEHRVLDDAGHNWIHVERPDAVRQAIEDLLRQGGR